MRLIDADALRDALKESYDKTWLIYQEQATLMDREICKAELVTFNEMLLRLKDAPTIDAVPVVRCKDCWKRGDDANCPMCSENYCYDEECGTEYYTVDRTQDNDFCNGGERWG